MWGCKILILAPSLTKLVLTGLAVCTMMNIFLHTDFFVFQYSPLAPVYADNLVAAMATVATGSDNTPQQSSPNQAADGGVLGGVLELMEDKGKPPLTGVYRVKHLCIYTRSIDNHFVSILVGFCLATKT